MFIATLKNIDRGDSVRLTLGETVVGRGPFLQVADKRVSRNHALVEIVDEIINIIPKANNPLFYKKKGSDEKTILTKDEEFRLHHGDQIGLLPDALWYEVSITGGSKSSQKNGLDDNPSPKDVVANGSTKKDPSMQKRDQVTPEKLSTQKKMASPLEKTRKLPNWMYQTAQTESPTKKKAPVKKKVHAVTSRTKGTPLKESKKRDLSDEDEDYEDAEPMPVKKSKSRRPPSIPSKKADISDVDDEDFDEPEPISKPKPRRAPPKAKKRDMSDENDDYEEPEPLPVSKPKQRRKAKAMSDDEDSQPVQSSKKPRGRVAASDSFGDEGTSSRSSRPSRAAAQVSMSYEDVDYFDDDSEELIKPKDDDSDFVAEYVYDEDSGSDFAKKKKGKGIVKKGKPTPRKAASISRKTPRKGLKRGGRRSHADDFDEEAADGEPYNPRPSKRRASTAAKEKTKLYVEEMDESDDFSAAEEVQKKPSRRKTPAARLKKAPIAVPVPERTSSRTARSQPKKYTEDSEEDDIEEEVLTSKNRSSRAKPRKYKEDSELENEAAAEESDHKKEKLDVGKDEDEEINEESKIERKVSPKPENHKEEASGDDDEDLEEQDGDEDEKKEDKVEKEIKKPEIDQKKVDDEDDGSGSDDDTKKHRPTCMYGKKCYRKNPDHFKECSHPGDDSYEEPEEGSGDEVRKKKKRSPQKRSKVTDKKSVLEKCSDDDGLPNTYDYDDSFLDDGAAAEGDDSGSPSSYDSGGGSDWEPTQNEDVSDLVKESKDFIKNKKMHKPIS